MNLGYAYGNRVDGRAIVWSLPARCWRARRGVIRRCAVWRDIHRGKSEARSGARCAGRRSMRTRRSNHAACPVTGSALGERAAGEAFGDQVVEEEARRAFGRGGVERPGALALADGVPRPDGVRVERGHAGDGDGDLAGGGGDAGPVAVLEAVRLPDGGGQVERVRAVDLAEPCVLAAPGVVHRHGALGERVDREGRGVGEAVGEGRVPDRERVHRLPRGGRGGGRAAGWCRSLRRRAGSGGGGRTRARSGRGSGGRRGRARPPSPSRRGSRAS